tara:strand:- start:225 stop:434 length:210 start_codon:yes stop_codon:yes gene_type:complete
MKYNKIEIIENTIKEAKRKFFIVSDKDLNELNYYSMYFSIDHYNDTEKKEDATPKKEIETFVKSILFIN